MERNRFFTQLSLLTIVVVAILLLLHYFFPEMGAHQNFSWASVALFVTITIVMFFTGWKAVLSTNKNLFINVVLIFMFGKMALSVLLIVLYTKLLEPDTKLFFIPFIIVYLFYTIFETYILSKVGKYKPEKDKLNG